MPSSSIRRTRTAERGCTAPVTAARSTSRTDASSKADADNANRTSQDASQSQSGSGGCGCGGSDPQIQALGQDAGNLQTVFGLSTVLQLAPKNSNGGASVWSPGNGGTTRQSNKASSNGDADNRNGLSQLGMQMQ